MTEYEWDHRNRLVRITFRATGGGQRTKIIEYAYDFGNRWVRKVLYSDGNGTVDASTIFVYDGPVGSADPLASGASQIVLQFNKTGTGDIDYTGLTHRYLWGTGVDQILTDEQVHYDWSPEDYITDALLWPLGDHLGSVRDVVDKYGTVRIHRAYDAYGNITSEELRNFGNQIVQPGQSGALLHLFAFTARPFDQDTLLQNNLHRWYDAAVGRWLSEDPIAADTNLYRYVRSNPVIHVDPKGEVPITCQCYSHWYNWATEPVQVECGKRVSTCCEFACSDLHGWSGDWSIVGVGPDTGDPGFGSVYLDYLGQEFSWICPTINKVVNSDYFKWV